MAGFVPAAASPGATKTICVGLIIDAHTISGPTSAKCVTVKAGTSGVGVLEAGGHSVTFRQDGLLCTIDGLPKTGCSAVDDTHYWAYYHRAPGSTTWSYSNEDSRTYQPVNRSTEGWVYDNGSKLEPKNVPASQMCAALLKAKPTPSPKATKTPRPPHSPTPSSRPSLATSKPAAKGGVRHHRLHRATPRAANSAAAQAVPTPSPTAASSGNSTAPKSSGHGNAMGALVAAGVIAVIAAATLVAARRRRS
ncbi:MAG: hypothetical protein ACTHK4_06145 [Mycobacteriales bacterium]